MIPETQVFKKAKTVCDIISTDSVHEEISEDSSPIRGSLDKSNQKSDFVPAGILKDPEDRYIRSDSYRGAAANFNTISNQEEERKVRFNSGLNATHRVSRHSKYTRPDEKAIEDYKDNRANRGKIRKEVKELTSPEALRLNREENERDIAHVSSV